MEQNPEAIGPATTTTNVSLSANHATSSATTIESVTAASTNGTIATNSAAITSIINTITRIKIVADFENLTSFLIVMIFIYGIVGVFFIGFASFIYKLHPKVQVDSTSTMYLHHDHKYLSDKRLPSFILKPREKTQLKAKFWLIDNLLPSDMASGKVNFEVEPIAVVVVKLTLGYNRGYLVRFVCSNLKLANFSSEDGGNWIMLGGTKNGAFVSGPWPQWNY